MFSKFAPKYAALALSVVAALSLAGCKDQAPSAQKGPQEVGVVTVEISTPVMTTELSGRTSAYQVAEVRPQISGIIQKRTFTEGQMVKAGEQLYQIDPALYEAAYEEAVANYELARANARRSAQLVKVNAVSKQDNDAAQAQMKTARAAMKTAKTNLDYTKVQSPISGRVGRSEVTPGALANAYQTFMTTVQQLDPIYVDVRQTSTEMLRLKHEIASGKIKANGGAVEVTVLLEDGSVYPQKGKLTFTGEEVDEGTGMVNLRAVVPNPNGDLLPGMFVRARIEEGARPDSVLLSQRCVMRDPKGQAYVYVVTPENTIEQRNVVADRVVGTNWLIESGLKAGEKVVIEGIGKVRTGAKVQIAQPAAPATEAAAK
ncbi:MAG TPA: efflux RND transporter periplasmic adaptor subunit [Candidatus Aphodousia faecigallinarum]|uniref:Efflux RND transporter periplasmic adaptor subunit n=1 Tax=Candidatus Aphodousia faecigallinarum TaxID=2840677 RepID=A0A9D1IGQ8_9BURK|nr:efflux RND transporter periplasmic adaptor subunit [Candidatus Aphodousia faecigallinarum]